MLGTRLLERENRQLDLLLETLDSIEVGDENKALLRRVIDDMRATLLAQANPEMLAPDISGQFESIAGRIDRLTRDMAQEGYPGPLDEALHAEAMAQPGWGESSTEISNLPKTDRGRIFDRAANTAEEIAKDYGKIRNTGPAIMARLDDLKQRIEDLHPDAEADTAAGIQQEELIGQIEKIYKRIDNVKIFPAQVTNVVGKRPDQARRDTEEPAGDIAVHQPAGDAGRRNPGREQQLLRTGFGQMVAEALGHSGHLPANGSP